MVIMRNPFSLARRRRQASNRFDSLREASRSKRRRSWTFERLEERFFLSATQIENFDGVHMFAVSSSTPEGRQLIEQLNQAWLAQANSGSGTNSLSLAPASVPTDPYLPYQWHLFNYGQIVNYDAAQDIFGEPGHDINVIPVWQDGITGAGVIVAVV